MKYLHRRHFRTLSIIGDIPPVAAEFPVLLLPNHSTWWDGFFVYLLNKALFRRTLYLMMLEHKLREFSFFSKVGAFSIEPAHPKGIITSLQYAATQISNDPSALLCLFPQGELLPPTLRPLGCKPGFLRLLKMNKAPLTLLPLSIRTLHLREQRPHVFFHFGEPKLLDYTGAPLPDVAWVEHQIVSGLDVIDDTTAAGDQGTPFFQGKSSPGEEPRPYQPPPLTFSALRHL